MEADTSIRRKTGHFYFALTRRYGSLTCPKPQPKMCAEWRNPNHF